MARPQHGHGSQSPSSIRTPNPYHQLQDPPAYLKFFAMSTDKHQRSCDPRTALKHQYSPLPEGWIRLIKLIPNQDSQAPVCIDFLDYHLSSELNTERPEYEALSYVWGSDTDRLFAWVGNSHDHSVPMTKNLYAALERLRNGSLARYLWVDSVCINQEDDDERSRQVANMAKIYHYAKCVVVWLEEVIPENPCLVMTDSSTSLKELRRAACRSQFTTTTDNRSALQIGQQAWQDVQGLLGRSWFRRMWVRTPGSILELC